VTWLLAYLLAGFVLNWIAVQIFHAPVARSWRIELAATVFFPIAIICGLVTRKRPANPKDTGA